MKLSTRLGSGVAALCCLFALSGCAQAEDRVPSPAPSMSVAPTTTAASMSTALPANVLYPFNSSAAIGASTVSVRITTSGKTRTYDTGGVTYKVGACKMSFAVVMFGQGSTTHVTQINQQQISTATVTGFLKAAHVTSAITQGLLATTETTRGAAALMQTMTATYSQNGQVYTVHARAFTNQRMVTYTQSCPKGDILDTAKAVRLMTG